MSTLRDIDWSFNGRHCDRELILVPAHTTIMRWVQRFTPEFVKRSDRKGAERTPRRSGTASRGHQRLALLASIMPEPLPAA